MKLRLSALGVMILGFVTTFLTATAQDKSVRPGINKSFENPKVEDYLKKFEGESREIAINSKEIIAACKLKAGMAVADVGAGTGLFARKFAAEVGDKGKVYAVDIAPNFLRYIEKTCVDAKIKNVETVLCDQFSTKLPKNSVDLVFICDAYHHFEFPQKTLQSIHEALRPGGRIVLIDFHRIEGKSSDFIMGHVRAGKEVFVREVTSAGFKAAGEETFLKENYLIRFDKVTSEPPEPDKKEVDLPAGHSLHGEAFNEGPRQKAYLMGTTGKVHLPITTKDALAEKFFDQGVGQLHGFWYFEAERSFRQVAAIDPSCAMAYWGMAMANFENLPRAKNLIKKAVELKTNASRREQLWIDGWAGYLNSYLNSAKEKKIKQQDYIKSLENILYEFPDDIEAKAFLAVRLWQFKGDLPIVSHVAVDALLDQVFAANPLHPAHHYRIHLWDGVKEERALESAARLGPSAPGIAHQWHMTGHIYSGLKRYADAAWAQEASARVDHAHMIRDRVMPDQIHNYPHNQEWLVRNLGQTGQVRRALDLAKNMIELPRHPKYNTLQMPRRSAFYGRVRLFEALELYELWDELIALCDTPYLEPTDLAAEQVRRIRALGLAHAGKGNRELLQEQIAALKSRPEKEKSTEKPAGPTPAKPESKAGENSKVKSTADKSKDDSAKSGTTSVATVKDALNELLALDAQLAGDAKAALSLATKVKGMKKSRLAFFYLAAGDEDKAETLAREATDKAKNEVVPLENYIDVLRRIGKAKEAGAAFARLRQISGQIDSLDVPIFRRLDTLAKEMGLPANWREVQAPAKDVGERPPLEQFGPIHWHPWSAPIWELPAGAGKTVSLKEYRGRPVIVVFYLGYGCLHCVEQLNQLAPRTKDFADAGISLIAVSSDSLDALTKSQQAYQKGKEFPFPLVSDAKLETFKTYRAFDDFENQPLHATFVLDGNGLVRWQDISYEPFTDVDFLLKEAQRQLQLPVSR